MEKIVQRNLLYDFYGELLTPHQREVYEDIIFQDLSLGEVASNFNISRQGVYDLVHRCDMLLEGYEEKLHLAARFVELKAAVGEMHGLTMEYTDTGDRKLIPKIEDIYKKILSEL